MSEVCEFCNNDKNNPAARETILDYMEHPLVDDFIL